MVSSSNSGNETATMPLLRCDGATTLNHYLRTNGMVVAASPPPYAAIAWY